MFIFIIIIIIIIIIIVKILETLIVKADGNKHVRGTLFFH